MNLLRETINSLQENGKALSDVKWVGRRSTNAVCRWEEFEEQSRYLEYDNGYGCALVPEDLVVVGDDWWLERSEYDGAEWWEYKTLPKKWVGNTTDLGLKFVRSW